MKLKLSVILFVLFACFSCASLVGVEADEANERTTTIEKEMTIEKETSIKDQVEALDSEDPRRQQIMTLTWQIQYQREKLKALELKYLAACYKDKEYRDALTAIERLNKQIRWLILL